MADPAAAAEAGASAPGMPQLDFTTFANQIFWLAVTLVAIWWVLTRIALPRISAVLAERSGTISNDLAAAEELALKVKEAGAAYDKALADARLEAGRIAAETRAGIQAELDAAMAEADARIGARAAESEAALAAIRAEAEGSVREVARAAAAEIVAALGGRPDPAAVEAAVAAQVKG